MFGGGGMNPRKMKQMMEQMGIDVTELDAEEVVIRTADEELVFDGPQVTRMDAQGKQTYQVVGDPEPREVGSEEGSGSASDAEALPDEGEEVDGDGEIPDEDVELVAERAGVGTSEARQALEATDGDLVAAIARLE